MDLYARLSELARARVKVAVVTVVESQGSTPRKPGTRMLVHPDGRTEGTIGGGTVEHEVRAVAARVLKTGSAELVHYNLTADLAMCCGGRMSLFVEVLMIPPALIVFGCGHVGAAVVRAAASLGFEITAVDDLPANLQPALLPQATHLVSSYEAADLGGLPFGEDAYILIATREHALDQRLLEFCLKKPHRFLGVIGSLRKAAMQRERLLAKGFSDTDLRNVRCPVGLDVGAQTPEEIAIAVCAELISVRRGGAKFAKR